MPRPAVVTRWRVEVTTTYYDVVEVEAATEEEARRRALEAEVPGLGVFSEAETHKAERVSLP